MKKKDREKIRIKLKNWLGSYGQYSFERGLLIDAYLEIDRLKKLLRKRNKQLKDLKATYKFLRD